MKRLVQPEWLDTLPPDDPRALRSRRDLRRINALMRHEVILAGALTTAWDGSAPGRITELGAGDGDFFLRVAGRLAPRWPGVTATLLDRQPLEPTAPRARFAALGWRMEAVTADVADWPQTSSDIVFANLFLHHFEAGALGRLLRLVSERSRLFIALEPRRAAWPWFCSRWLGAAGCNDVTRHDAAVSVRAGFAGTELSALWPDRQTWRLAERRAGWFSHLFIAQKAVAA